MRDYLENLIGIRVITLVAGTAGAIIALSLAGPKNFIEALATFAAGVSCAVFLAPWVQHVWSLPENLYGGVAFVLGLGGMPIARGLYRYCGKVVKSIQLPHRNAKGIGRND